MVLYVSYFVVLATLLWLWNQRLYGFAALLLVIASAGFAIAPLFTTIKLLALCLPVSFALSLYAWWLPSQFVKGTIAPPLIHRFRLDSASAADAAFIVMVAVPIAIWVDWRFALAATVAYKASMVRAGRVATKRYVLERAAQLQSEHPEWSKAEALVKAEIEMRVNVSVGLS